MASTYSNLKFELIGTGELSGTWGSATNTNIGTAIEQAIVGMATLDSGDFTANVATLALTNTNALQDARALCLNIAAGAVSAAGTVNVPAIEKPYIIINGSSYTVTVKVSGQTGVAVPAGKRTVVYNNGTDVGSQIDWLAALDLTSVTVSGGTANGVAYLNGSKVLTTGSALTFDGTNLMVGTGTPGAPLSFADVTGIKIQLNADAANYYSISKSAATIAGDGQFTFTSGQSSAGEFAWNSGGSTRMLLGSTGNWLLGTISNPDGYRAIITGTSLSKPLQVRGNNASNLSESQFANDGTGIGIGQYGSTYSGGSNFGIGPSGSFVIGTDAAPFAVGTYQAQPLYLGTGNTPVQTIDANGRTQFGATSLPSGVTSYLTLYRSANNTTDGTMTIYNPSTGGNAVAGYYLGNATAANVGGISLIGSGFAESGQYRRNDTYVYNGGSNITIHAEASGKAVYQAVNNTLITTTNAAGFGVNVTPTVRLQVAGTAGNINPFIKYDVTSNNDTFNWVDTSLASNLSAGKNLISFIGQAASTKNAAYFGFKYSSSTSNDNLLTMGLFSVDNALNINGYGNVSLYGAVTTANGVGITFPATQSASSDANCLDDYEEGTWTPVLTSDTPPTTVSYNFNSGVYRKIGNMVYVQFGMNVGTRTGGSGAMRISGLPFASITRGAYQESSSSLQGGNWVNSAIAGQTYLFVGNGVATMDGRIQNNSDTILQITQVQGLTYMNCTMVYVTS